MAISRANTLRSILFGNRGGIVHQCGRRAQDARINQVAQPMSDALRSVAQKTGESILFTPNRCRACVRPPISGDMDARQAVSLLTKGTDLEVVPGRLQWADRAPPFHAACRGTGHHWGRRRGPGGKPW